ncbi:hypothetical protein FRB96_000829 [Tulasnella sp. 330]|nr:hypothetical protein FRB96_000829 [Tulasnella sp. 330]
MLQTLLEDMGNSIKRIANGDYRKRSVEVIAKCRSLVTYINNMEEANVHNMDDMKKRVASDEKAAFKAARVALEAVSANPPCLHRDIINQFNLAEALLYPCTQSVGELLKPNCNAARKDVEDAKKGGKSPFDVLNSDLKGLISSYAPVNRASTAPNVVSAPGTASLTLTPTQPLSPPVAPSITLPAPLGTTSTLQALSDSIAKKATSTIPMQVADAAGSLSEPLGPLSALPSATALSVKVMVYDSDLENPQIDRTCKCMDLEENDINTLLFN